MEPQILYFDSMESTADFERIILTATFFPVMVLIVISYFFADRRDLVSSILSKDELLWTTEKRTKLGHRKGVQIGVCSDM